MAYYVYLNKLLLPVAPEKIQIKIKNNNKTMQLINFGEINTLKSAGLSEISFDVLLPNIKHSLAFFQDAIKKASY